MRVMWVFLWTAAVLSICGCAQNVDAEKGDFSTLTNPKQVKSKQFWMDEAQNTLLNKLSLTQNRNRARNVIFFIGDGMSVDTVTASRIYEGQLKGILGESNKLSFEKFPYVGLSKTYCADKQVSDSACTATAYMCGVKTNYYTIGVTASTTLNDCESAKAAPNQLRSIAGWAVDAGKSAGIVTTTRVTHASPAGAYAHTSNREFESDFDVETLLQAAAGRTPAPKECPDIAKQLIENEVSKRFTVILGGGAQKFLPNGTTVGQRLDGRNLIYEWMQSKQGVAKFVSNRTELLNTNLQDTDYLLGLFSSSHMSYHLDNDGSEPTLAEMTESAIRMLQKNDKGYFLFVEGGRIDHAHHETRAVKALDETVQFSQAIQRAKALTTPLDTLIVVSADHGHTMTINGYPALGNKITGLGTDLSDLDGLPYSTLSYANGPAFTKFYKSTADAKVSRLDWKKMFASADKDFQYPAGVPVVDETHGGGDVAVYADGPWAHLFSGVLEQSALPAIMGYAACIGPGLHACYSQY